MKEVRNQKEELYQFLSEKENQDKFYRLAFSYVKNREAALDIVQDAVVKALNGYEKLREKIYLKTWFYRILVNAAVDFIRKDTKYVLTEDTLESGTKEAEPEKSVSKLDLLQALNELSEELRIIILLRFFEDLKIADIAEILQTPQSTIKTRLRSALNKLSTLVEGNYDGREIQ